VIPLLIIAAFQAILLVVLLLVKREKSVSDFILASYLFLSAITILLAHLEIWNRNIGYPYPWLINLSTPLILLVGPMLWLYVKSLTHQYFKFKPIYSLLALPFLVVLGMLISRNYLEPEAAKIASEQTESFKNEFSFLFIVGLIALSNIGYTFWGLVLIKNYRKKIKTFFSQTETIDLAWLKFLLISALICYTSISGLYIADSAFNITDYQTLQLMGFSIASVFVLALGFFGLKQGNIFTSAPIGFDMERAINIGETKTLINKDEEDFVFKLLAQMKEHKPYLNPDITLAKLSDELKISPEYLSSVINGRLSMNFFDFVNHHRIEEFKVQCRDPKNRNLTLISLAYDCGFNSKATFNRVFKREVGCTPSEYFKGVK
jgi:AraC-like DNA-binding protein